MSVIPQQLQGRREVPWHRWQDWISLILGVWLFIAPWIWGNTSHPSVHEYASSWDSWIIGAVFVVFSLCALSNPRALWAEWIDLIASVWLFFAPWILGFSAAGHSAAWNSWAVGIIVFIMALSSLSQTKATPTVTS